MGPALLIEHRDQSTYTVKGPQYSRYMQSRARYRLQRNRIRTVGVARHV